PCEQLSCHDHALDLVGALVDLGDLGVAHHALDGEVAGVARAAEELHGVGGDLHGHVGGVGLGGTGHVGLPGVTAFGRCSGGVHQMPRGFDLGAHVGEHELHTLEVTDGLAELFTFLDVVHG